MYNDKKIALTFTTCKRLDLFQKTFISLKERCSDFHLIDEIIIVDDNSSDDDIKCMEIFIKGLVDKQFSIHKNQNKGHPNSLIILQEVLSSKDITYQFQCEDDWEFTHNRDFITDSIDILNNIPNVAVVIFRDFTNQPRESMYRIKKQEKAFECCVHNYDSGKYHGSWPPFTLNPSIHNFKLIYDNVGKYQNVSDHERSYGNRCHNAGLKIAYFTDKDYIIHIGQHVSSYNLNSTTK